MRGSTSGQDVYAKFLEYLKSHPIQKENPSRDEFDQLYNSVRGGTEEEIFDKIRDSWMNPKSPLDDDDEPFRLPESLLQRMNNLKLKVPRDTPTDDDTTPPPSKKPRS